MQFVQTIFLGALAAMAIPILVHLMFRSQARKVPLGTLRFLRQVLERNAQRQRVMRWLLLALRMAGVACLALLFARPYLLETMRGADRKLVMILLDRSATMGLKGDQGRLVEQAIAEARQLIAQQNPKTMVEVALFDHRVQPLGTASDAGTQRETALTQLDALPRPEMLYGSTSYAAAMAWARDVAIKSTVRQQELHVWTDLQQSGLAWAESDPMPETVQVHLHDLGRAVVNNVAVTDARPLRTVVRPNEALTVRATIHNGTAYPVADQVVTLTLASANGRVQKKERVKLEPQANATLTFELAGLAEGLWKGVVSVEADDDLRFDNTRHVAIRVAPAWKVLLCDGDPKPSVLMGETYFLSAALKLAGPDETWNDALFDVTTTSLGLSDTLPALEPWRVVVLANAAALSRQDAERLQAFVRQGGGLLVFGGDRITATSTESLAAVGLTPGEIRGPHITTDLPFRVDRWRAGHSLMKPFDDPQHGDLRRWAFRGYTRLVAHENRVAVLAQWRGGDPFLTEHTLGEGTVLWCTAAADRSWSDWVNSPLYLPLVHQLVGRPLGLNDGGPVRAAMIESQTDANEAEFAAEHPPGVHSRAQHVLVTNVSPRESETDRLTDEVLANRFRLNMQQAAGVPQVVNAAPHWPTELRSHEQWPWLAGVLSLVLVLEAAVANRTVS